MTLIQRRKKTFPEAVTVQPVADEPTTNEAAELFALAQAGGDRNRVEAIRRIRSMSAVARRELRLSIERLDGLMDEVALELHLQRHTQPCPINRSSAPTGEPNHER